MSATHTPQVWTFAGNAQEVQRRLAGSGHNLPRTDLLCLQREEAASLLGLPALDNAEAVAQAAAALRTAVCGAVVITSGDSDYAATPQASGWLSQSATASQHKRHPDAGKLFAEAAGQAMADGFVAMEAIVLASMARADAMSQQAGAGPLQQRPDFAQRIANLPAFSLPHPTSLSGFPTLGDTHLGLYAVVDSADWVARVVAAGVRTVQLRIKDANGPEHRDFVRREIRRSIDAATSAGAQLFINDHWQLAIEERSYGVHLGQEDLHVADLTAIARAGVRLGISTHAYWEVCRAWALRPSYIACGPIHPTKAKAMPWIPQGNGNLAYWCKLLPTPVVGIAGMDMARTQEAAACGANGVAVISAITGAPSPEAAILDLHMAVQRGRNGPVTTAPLLPRPTLAPASNGSIR